MALNKDWEDQGRQFTQQLVTAGMLGPSKPNLMTDKTLSAFPAGEPKGIKTIDIAGGAVKGAANVMGIKPGGALPANFGSNKVVTQSVYERPLSEAGIARPSSGEMYTPEYTGMPTPAAVTKLPGTDIAVSETGGRNTYTLPGTEGTMSVGPQRFFDKAGNELPAGANIDISDVVSGVKSGDELARERIFNETAPGGIPTPSTGGIPTGGNVIRSWTGGERSLAEAEKAAGGGVEPIQQRAFDQAQFDKIVGGIGAGASPRLKAQIFETMLKDVEQHNMRVDELQKAQMQFGQGSPAMLSAQSDAAYKDALSRIGQAKNMAEVQGIIAETEKTKTQIGGIPATTEHLKAETVKLQEETRLAKYVPYAKAREAELKNLEQEMISPQAKELKKVAIEQKYAVINQGMQMSDQIKAQFPQWTVPERIEVGKVYTFAPGKRYRVKPDWTFESV